MVSVIAYTDLFALYESAFIVIFRTTSGEWCSFYPAASGALALAGVVTALMAPGKGKKVTMHQSDNDKYRRQG
jgi:hypothetical protein